MTDRSFGVAAAALALMLPLAVHAASPAVEQLVAIGTVGPYRVGANLAIRDGKQVIGGHYYYAGKLVDIPLTGEAQGEAVSLKEPGGGTFTLHLVGNGSNGGQPLTWATSVALAGSWTQGDKVLPVDLKFDQIRNGAPGDRWYADITDAPDADFEAMARRFLHAVMTDDRRTAAAAVSYPLTVNGSRPSPMSFKDRAALLAHWDAVFPPTLVAKLRDAMPHEMFVRDHQAMVADGGVWFDAKGATVVNLPQ